MNKILNKNDVVKRISKKLSDDRIVIGGNKELYKRKYHLKYTQMIIEKILYAFWDVVAETIESGDVINLYSYVKIEPNFFKERVIKPNLLKDLDDKIVPGRYKIKFTIGSRLREACSRLTEKVEGKADES